MDFAMAKGQGTMVDMGPAIGIDRIASPYGNREAAGRAGCRVGEHDRWPGPAKAGDNRPSS